MKLVYAGTPEFAARALEALVQAGHDIPLVLTQPDRPAGRGMKLRMSPVKEVALGHGLTVAQPAALKSETERELIRQARPEWMVVAAYGLILPQAVLDIPARGCINIHASLLPRWRGAAPIHRAIEAGDRETGISLMHMEAGLDTGPVYRRLPLGIAPDDTTGSLHDKLAALGAQGIVDLLADLADTELKAQPQDEGSVTYAHKVSKEEARIQWDASADLIQRKARAFDPFPGVFTTLEGAPFKLWHTRAVPGSGAPGTLLRAGPRSLVIACGRDALEVLEVQLAGGRRLPVDAFLAGHPLPAGAQFS